MHNQFIIKDEMSMSTIDTNREDYCSNEFRTNLLTCIQRVQKKSNIQKPDIC